MNRPTRRLTLWILGLAVLCTSCSVTPPQEINKKYRSILEQRRIQYKIKDGDTITIRIYQHTGDLDEQTLLVLPDGRTDPYFMPNYRVLGKTIPELEADLKSLVGPEAPENAEVSIFVTPRGELVYLYGEFGTAFPAPVPLRPDMTLQDALALGHGVRVTADTDYCLLRRPFGNLPGYPDRFRVDLNDFSEEIILLPNDQLHLGRTALATAIIYLREYVFGVVPSQVYGSAVFAAL